MVPRRWKVLPGSEAQPPPNRQVKPEEGLEIEVKVEEEEAQEIVVKVEEEEIEVEEEEEEEAQEIVVKVEVDEAQAQAAEIEVQVEDEEEQEIEFSVPPSSHFLAMATSCRMPDVLVFDSDIAHRWDVFRHDFDHYVAIAHPAATPEVKASLLLNLAGPDALAQSDFFVYAAGESARDPNLRKNDKRGERGQASTHQDSLPKHPYSTRHYNNRRPVRLANHGLCFRLAHNMAEDASTDACFTGDSDLLFCGIHVVETCSRLIVFSKKSIKKAEECAVKWMEVQESLESKVAAEVLQHKEGPHESTLTERRQQCIPGYHAECYRHFCNITTINQAIAKSRRKKDAEKPEAGEPPQEAVPDGEADEPAPKRLLRSMTSHSQQTATVEHTDPRHVLPARCIICKGSKYTKEINTGKRNMEKLMQCETKQGGQLMTAATMKKDEALLLHIRDRDLVALEARYHKSCYQRYTRVVIDFAQDCKQDNQQQVYEKSYSSFCKRVIEKRIIHGKEILRLAKLNRLFISEVREVEGLDASSHKTGRLKARLKRSHPLLCFTRPFRQVESEIVFVESLVDEELVEGVVEDNSTEGSDSSAIVGDNQQEGSSPHHPREMFHAAQTVQNSIINATNHIQWPPTSEDTTLHTAEQIVPDDLYNLLAWTTGASNEPKESGKVDVPDQMHHRLLSIAQDIMHLKSEGRNTQPSP
ncbi:uncharacterized protein LOC129694708 isoform X8 [Leucoraja erinacea]|uniref:uncharacterized protein LOC129694708 isoform X8 n=1 Tax=Leucoraja erinaceus TaxID=7782 RepID=UPI00245527DF|nr:uncharacterized protein LOC129694708 isoform X8 [Leucoraja erinacea]